MDASNRDGSLNKIFMHVHAKELTISMSSLLMREKLTRLIICHQSLVSTKVRLLA
jgi:hypothetical protein